MVKIDAEEQIETEHDENSSDLTDSIDSTEFDGAVWG